MTGREGAPGPTDELGEIVKKLDILAVTIAMLFVAAAFAGGVSGGSDERTHYCDAEFTGSVMDAGYRAHPSNAGE
jgi:hypothetical protein